MDWFVQFKELFSIATDIEAVYWIVALAASFLFSIKLIMSMLGADALDFDVDMEADAGHVSVDTILAFLTAGGWIGVLCYRNTDLGMGSILLIAVASGMVGFVSTYYFMRAMKRLESSGTIELKNAIGKTAKVYLTIPGDTEGFGQVQVSLQGGLRTMKARSDVEIRTGEKVLVFDVGEDNILIVSPYKGTESVQ